jgi:hypothetical protein
LRPQTGLPPRRDLLLCCGTRSPQRQELSSRERRMICIFWIS